MEKINLPEALPKCKIINRLVEKANERVDIQFDYIYHLEELRKIISLEVSTINQLFPEYTPHDEQYHLKRLFFVADDLLGDEIIQNMNATELFLLSIGLYGHDWGMAVSEIEKEYILSNNFSNNDFKLLDDEFIRLNDFFKNRNVINGNLDIEDWREYVRITHAFRSGMRIRNHFEKLNSGIADFASRICEGHWLDFNIIDDFDSYPVGASILRETVNVKAITLYLRLIDLLDLGEDRTPYVLWKFVAPRNKISKIEWAKHRALQPVTFPSYQSTRSIQIDGSTSQQDVFMSIMDLKSYVDNQFRQCSDILNRNAHPYHKLNLSHIDWRIAPKGFEPVAIHFQFDRGKMFDILSNEIYQGNHYTFIRELLQNSIDAIEMRLEVLQKIKVSFEPYININVTETNDFYLVEIIDNGIGMDEYIIRNYLAVAGKSYYRSLDFQKEGLKMNPISRFGIGVLSCFMYADLIEIKTHKDPNTTNSQDYFKIRIPAKENFFRIEKNFEKFDIGTSFEVYVSKNKLHQHTNADAFVKFNVTNYLKKTAGFVNLPISIFENGVKTLIKNPNSLLENNTTEFQLNYSFPFEHAFYPQYVENAKNHFIEKKIHLKNDLNLNEFDGCITFLIPKSDDLDVLSTGGSWPVREVRIVSYHEKFSTKKKLGWSRGWTSLHSSNNINEFNEYSYNSFAVFMNGILVENVRFHDISDYESNNSFHFDDDYTIGLFIAPYALVNILKPEGHKIDLARTKFESKEQWDKPIWEALYVYIKKTIIDEIVKLTLKERLFSIARVTGYYYISTKVVFEKMISKTEFAFPIISQHGTLEFSDFNSLIDNKIYVAPIELYNEYFNILDNCFYEYKNYSGILKKWRGRDVLFFAETDSLFGDTSLTLGNVSNLNNSFINRYFSLDSIEFIASPLGKEYPLAQMIFTANPDNAVYLSENELYDIDIDNIDNYSLNRIYLILKSRLKSFPRICKFNSPYDDKLFYGFEFININNKQIKCFVNICLKILKIFNSKSEKSYLLFDFLNDFSFINKYDNNDLESRFDLQKINQEFKDFYSLACKNNLIQQADIVFSDIEINDFVENTVYLKKEGGTLLNVMEVTRYMYASDNEWGQVINS